MGWFEKKAERPKIPPAKALWAICPKCKSHMEKSVWKGNNCICPKCNYHGRLSARERIAQVADEGRAAQVTALVGIGRVCQIGAEGVDARVGVVGMHYEELAAALARRRA